MQNAGGAGRNGGTVFFSGKAFTAGFNADDTDALVVKERMEDADGIRSATDGRDDHIRQAAFRLEHLCLGFLADDRLEVTNHLRVRMRTGSGADQVVGILDIGNPVTQRLVHGILERAVAGRDRLYLGAKQLHAENVRGLARDVGSAHVDDTRQAEARCDRCRRNAVLSGTGFCDDAGLAHALGKQDLAKAIVDLVRTRVVQLFTFEVNLRTAEFRRQTLCEIERARAAGIMGAEML